MTEKPSTPEVFLQVGYTWYLEVVGSERLVWDGSRNIIGQFDSNEQHSPQCLLRPEEVEAGLLHVHLRGHKSHRNTVLQVHLF